MASQASPDVLFLSASFLIRITPSDGSLIFADFPKYGLRDLFATFDHDSTLTGVTFIRRPIAGRIRSARQQFS
jgi:hypothetical protein